MNNPNYNLQVYTHLKCIQRNLKTDLKLFLTSLQITKKIQMVTGTQGTRGEVVPQLPGPNGFLFGAPGPIPWSPGQLFNVFYVFYFFNVC